MIADSFEAANSAAQDVEAAVTLQSTERIQSAIDHLFVASGSLKLSLGTLPDVEFPEAGSEASAETPTPEFKTPLNLDADRDTSTMTPSVRVTTLETSIVVSGDGVSFTCFDVAPGEWEMNFACVGDSTGAAMFGTTLKDTIFLSQGVFRSTTIEEPIEAKLLMTCLHKWTYQITKQ